MKRDSMEKKLVVQSLHVWSYLYKIIIAMMELQKTQTTNYISDALVDKYFPSKHL